jgi:hypothetical protein
MSNPDSIPTDVIASLNSAMAIQRQEQQAYFAALMNNDANGMKVHRQAYQKACDLVDTAQNAVEGKILNTPEALQGLSQLAAANKKMTDAAAELAKDAKNLALFTTAVNAVVQILGIVAAAG